MPYLSLKADPKDESKQVPYLEDRQTLGHWAGKQIENATMHEYRANWNRRSLDGLPGLRVARKDFGETLWLGDVGAQVRKRNGVLLVLVAVVSALSTVATLWFLQLLDLSRWDAGNRPGNGRPIGIWKA